MATPSPFVQKFGSDALAGAGLRTLPQPYLLFLGDASEASYAKTAFGLRDWAPERCLGEFGLPEGRVTLGLPKLTPQEAKAAGARTLVIGVVNSGGFLPDQWIAALADALEQGLDIVSGMHMQLADHPVLSDVARRFGRQLIDVRQPPAGLPVANGRKRGGKRLLTVGTDCALGKKYAALAIARELTSRGVSASFRATGQTGIMISGSGIPMDAVVSDFAAGAAEYLSPDAPADHWDVIEGQGSLFHPAYAGVSLALLHGSQPDVIIVCHDPGRTNVLGYGHYRLPTLEETISLNLALASRTNPAVRCGGICLNTSAFSEPEADRLVKMTSERLHLPVADPIRAGDAFHGLVDNCLA